MFDFNEEDIQDLFEDIKNLHTEIASSCGESIDFIDGGKEKLLSAINTACGGIGDEEYYKSPYKKASALTFYLANNHCFVNCNKRLAFEVGIVFLDYYYGLKVKIPKKKEQKYLNNLVVIEKSRPREDRINELADFYREAR